MGSSTQERGDKLGACMDEAEKARRGKGICNLRAGERGDKHAKGRGYATCVQGRGARGTQREDSMQPACREEAEKTRKWKRACSLRADGAERSTQEDESASAACLPSENE